MYLDMKPWCPEYNRSRNSLAVRQGEGLSACPFVLFCLYFPLNDGMESCCLSRLAQTPGWKWPSSAAETAAYFIYNRFLCLLILKICVWVCGLAWLHPCGSLNRFSGLNSSTSYAYVVRILSADHLPCPCILYLAWNYLSRFLIVWNISSYFVFMNVINTSVNTTPSHPTPNPRLNDQSLIAGTGFHVSGERLPLPHSWCQRKAIGLQVSCTAGLSHVAFIVMWFLCSQLVSASWIHFQHQLWPSCACLSLC